MSGLSLQLNTRVSCPAYTVWGDVATERSLKYLYLETLHVDKCCRLKSVVL